MEPMTPVRHRRADRYRELPAEAPQEAPAENVQEPIQEPIAASPTLRAQTPPRPAALRAPRPQLPVEAEAAAPMERPPRAAASRKRPQEKGSRVGKTTFPPLGAQPPEAAARSR